MTPYASIGVHIWCMRNQEKIVFALRAAAAALTADFASIPHFKNKWRRMTAADVAKDPSLQEELFELIRTAYRPIGGHFKITKPRDLLDGDISFFEVVDVDDDAEADAVNLVKDSRSGEKHVGIGHDGGKPAKDEVIRHKARSLAKRAVYTEASDALGHILLTKFQVPSVNDPEMVRKVLKGKDIDWVGLHPNGKYPNNPGWYYRSIAGHRHMKIMLGNPRT